MIIAIDGTFASGKGTLAQKLALHYGVAHLDTGKLYRAVAHYMLNAEQDPNDAQLAEDAALALKASWLDNDALRSGPVGVAASKVAVHAGVREALLNFQRDFAKTGGVLDGRDIGTVICPEADVKLYIDAKADVRAARRHQDLSGRGEDISYDEVLKQLKERDYRDANRTLAPLKPAKDAHLIDTTKLSIERAFEAAVRIVDAVLARK